MSDEMLFWLCVAGWVVAGIVLVGLLVWAVTRNDDDDTPVKPPNGSDDWKGWR